MKKISIDEAIALLLTEGVLHEPLPNQIRNYKLKARYKELRYRNQLSCKKAREKVAEEFFIDDKTVQNIIYGDRKK